MKTEKILDELKKKIVKLYPHLIGIYLYGFRAKGNFDKESDLDILLLFSGLTSEKKFEIYGIVSYIEYKFDVFIDIKILTPTEFRKNPFYFKQVTSSGIYFAE